MATRRPSKRAAARDRSDPAESTVPAVATNAAPSAPHETGTPAVAAAPVAAPAPAVTRLAGSLSIRAAGQVAADLRAALATGAVRIDAGAVEQVDTAGLQLLVATAASAATRGASFEWLAVSGAVRDAATHLGLAAALRLPAAG